jgi:hypothetical protein
VSLDSFLQKHLEDIQDIDGCLTDEYADEDDDLEDGEILEESSGDDDSSDSEVVDLELPEVSRKQRKKKRSKKNKHDVRDKKQAQHGTDSPIKSVVEKQLKESARSPIPLNLDAQSDLAVTLPAWTGMRSTNLPQNLFTVGQLKDMNMTYFEWDGV